MGDLSAHFSRREFDCHDGARAAPTAALVEHLEQLRAMCGGRPLRIVSGYRSPSWNRHVGGARDSRHMHNDAADLETGYATLAQAKAAGFTGIGWHDGPDGTRWAIHVDTRPGKRVTFKD